MWGQPTSAWKPVARPFRRDGDRVAVDWPIIPFNEAHRADELASCLGKMPAETLDSAFGAIAIFESEREVADLQPDFDKTAPRQRYGYCDCSRRGCGRRAPRLCAQAEASGRSGLWDGASHFGAIVVPTARPEFIGIPAAFAARRASVLPPQRQPDHDCRRRSSRLRGQPYAALNIMRVSFEIGD
jgi:hypothetical protein